MLPDVTPWDQGEPSGLPSEDCLVYGPTFKYQTERCNLEFCFACHYKEQVSKLLLIIENDGHTEILRAWVFVLTLPSLSYLIELFHH